VRNALKKPSPQRFDLLLALTWALTEVQFLWTVDNEERHSGGECERAVDALATARRARGAGRDALLAGALLATAAAPLRLYATHWCPAQSKAWQMER